MTRSFWIVSAIWAVPFIVWALYIMAVLTDAPRLDYNVYLGFRTPLSCALVILALVGVYIFASDWIFQNGKTSTLRGWANGLLVFWALAPALWFFVEYYAVESGHIVKADVSKDDLAANIKSYADFSAKVWAAFALVYGFSVKAQIDHRKERSDNQAVAAKAAAALSTTTAEKGALSVAQREHAAMMQRLIGEIRALKEEVKSLKPK